MFTIVPNDGAKIPATLYKDGITFNIPVNAPVKAAILTRDQTKLLAGPVSLSSLEAGADWANSAIVAVFTAQELSGITTAQKLALEIQVEDGDPLTWFYEGEAVIGHI